MFLPEPLGCVCHPVKIEDAIGRRYERVSEFTWTMLVLYEVVVCCTKFRSYEIQVQSSGTTRIITETP